MLWRVVETCATQPPSLLRKGKSGSVCAMEVVHVQEWNIMKHLEAYVEATNEEHEWDVQDWPSQAVWRLGIVQLSVVCGICVWSSWRNFDSLRSPVALQWQYSVYLTGWVKFHLAACRILLFLSMFYKYLKRLGSHFLDWERVQVKKCQAISFWHDKDGSCRYWSKCLRHTLLLPLLCVFKLASPWCLGACILPQPWPLPWHTWNRCSQGKDLGIEAVNR